MCVCVRACVRVCVCVCVALTSKLVSQLQNVILALLVVSIFQMGRYVAGSVGPIAIFLPTHSLYYKEDPLG